MATLKPCLLLPPTTVKSCRLLKPPVVAMAAATTVKSCLLTANSSQLLKTPVLLIGPPEIYQQPPKPARSGGGVDTVAAAPATTGDPFMDVMVADFNNTTTLMPSLLLKGRTENNSPTFLSSGNPCLDFFFHIVPDTPPESVASRLKLAWDHDPLKALKLVCNLRGVKGTGKSDREGFYTSALWLHEHHPKTLAGNAASFAEFGYFKDLLEILFRILDGADARKKVREIGELWKARMLGPVKVRRGVELSKAMAAFHGRNNSTPEERRIESARRAVERFNNDEDFRFLHDCVSDLFAERLRSDMEMLKLGKLNRISLAAKWCPSLYSSFDRITLLCETIAKKVFPVAEFPEYEGVEEAHYAYRVRDRLRKEVLVPLRKALQLPEVYIGANDWGSLPYNRVASVAMKNYMDLFFIHDGERFREYLGKVKSGKATIAAGALLPHQIIESLDDEHGGEVAELQWRRMVDDMAKIGKLSNCLAICDVSGSMIGLPMEVSVALGILVSELSEEPWKGKLITFSENPELQKVEGESLKSKAEFVKSMDWGFNTDFQKVFDVILEVAVKGKLKAEDMIKRLFVFSDMEFDEATATATPWETDDEASANSWETDDEALANSWETDDEASANLWETDYEAIVRKFKENGYGECVPEIVFWNLRDSMATPVPANLKGVALVSGYSKNLMKMFLEDGGIMDPVKVMDTAIAGKKYQKLVVVD